MDLMSPNQLLVIFHHEQANRCINPPIASAAHKVDDKVQNELP